jgi:hypothetical protein
MTALQRGWAYGFSRSEVLKWTEVGVGPMREPAALAVAAE